ncbi:TetR/AcrR family transcriptional regulator [Streptomyces cavernae]|uniref:TetR/AcrR family transcriptional regulator n=1 Tax=Streptomyces cavernae TaxID=2259034 RepID=UPI003B75CFAF
MGVGVGAGAGAGAGVGGVGEGESRAQRGSFETEQGGRGAGRAGSAEEALRPGRAGSGEGGRGGVVRRDPGAVLDSLIEGHIDFALDDRPLITLHDRELDRLRDSDRKLVRQLQRQYVELWVGVVRELYPHLAEPVARAAVHAVFGLLNSTPHLGRPGSLPGRAATAALLHRMARGAFASAGGPLE